MRRLDSFICKNSFVTYGNIAYYDGNVVVPVS